MVSRAVLRCIFVSAAVLTIWIGTLVGLGYATGVLGSGTRFNVVVWIGSQLPRQWLNGPAHWLGGGFQPANGQQLVTFFGETSALAAAETEAAYDQANGIPDSAAMSAVNARQDALTAMRPSVDARLAEELTAVLHQERLDTPVVLLRGARVVWPPVDFAFDQTPYILILSRRDRIGVVDTTLLRGDLSESEIQRIEQSEERRGYSALVDRLGGIATYPSLVEDDDNYVDSLNLVSHEWTHQYLFFHRLGFHYFSSPALTTINETVANISGDTLGGVIRARFPLPSSPATVHPAVPPPDPAVDFDRTLHQLRVNVDSLLAQGKVSEAEQQMDETQRFLAQHGYYVRKINQAYFAFYGTYANTAASTNPLGPQLVSLRRRYVTLGDFIHAVQNVESVADLRRLIAQSR